MRVRRLASLGLGALFVGLGVASAVLAPPRAAAANGLQLTTPYPAVVVGAGDSVDFQLGVSAPAGERVDLSVSQVPAGWSATLRGGGFVLDGVMANPSQPPSVQLTVRVPGDAKEGTYQLVVTGRSASGSTELPLQLRVAGTGGGGATLTASFPGLQGPATGTFTFDLKLENDTTQTTRFGLEAAGPDGWTVSAHPSGDAQATSISVNGGDSQQVSVTVTPSSDAAAGNYPIVVRALGGNLTADAQLAVQITGTYGLKATTPDGRLNAQVSAGSASTMSLVVQNTGSAPLQSIAMSASTPSGWKVAFSPSTITTLAANATSQVTVTITPSNDAVAGDYDITMTASASQASQSVDIRATVQTSPIWGVVGIGIIVLVFAGLGLVFRQYGRR